MKAKKVWVPRYLNIALCEGFQGTFGLEFIVHDPRMKNTRRKVTSSPVMLVDLEFRGDPIKMTNKRTLLKAKDRIF